MSVLSPTIPLPVVSTPAYADRTVVASSTKIEETTKKDLWYRRTAEESTVKTAGGEIIDLRSEVIHRSDKKDDEKSYKPYSHDINMTVNGHEISWSKSVGIAGGESLSVHIPGPDGSDGQRYAVYIEPGKISYRLEVDTESEAIPISREAFVGHVGTALGTALPAWVATLKGGLPKETLERGHAERPEPGSVLNARLSRLDITTDGTCTILRDPQRAGANLLFRSGVQLAMDKPPATGSFEPDTLHGTSNANPGVLAAIMNDPALKSSLPRNIHQQLAEAVKSGAIVRIDHVGEGEASPACSAAGVKPVSQETPRRR